MDFKKLFVLIAASILSLSPLFPQDGGEEPPPPSVPPDELDLLDAPSKDRWQLLEWSQEDVRYVQKFSVVIEERDPRTGAWTRARSITTKDNSTSVTITPNLKPGNYRYKVAPYNLVGLLEEYSDWCDFSIYFAHQPEISDLDVTSSHTQAIYLEEVNDGRIVIKGRNLFLPRQDVYDINFTRYVLKKEGSGRVIEPELVSRKPNGREVTLRIDLDSIEVGEYNLVAVNACGLETGAVSANRLTIKYKKPLDVNISAGYMCPYIAADDTFDKYLGSRVYPAAALMKLSVLPLKKRKGYFGLETMVSYMSMNRDTSDYGFEGSLLSGCLDLVYQYPFRKISPRNPNQKMNFMTLEIHGGIGVEWFKDFILRFDHGIESETLNSTNLAWNLGVSAQYFISKRVFAEADVDWCMARTSDMGFQIIRPGILIGWQF